MKICRDCGKEKPVKQFVTNKAFKDKRDTLCLECNRKRVKEWRKKNPTVPHGKRKSMSAEYREIIITALTERDGFSCGMCGDTLEGTSIHIDHIIPVALGGANTLTNVRLTHSKCNIASSLEIRRIKHGY